MSSAQTLNAGLRVVGVGLLLVGVFLTFMTLDHRLGALFGLLLVLVLAGVSVVTLSDTSSAPTSRVAVLRRGFGELSRVPEKRRRL